MEPKTMNEINFEGKHKFNGSYFYVGSQKICWKERKKEVEKKPKYYLVSVGSSFNYISSLYPDIEEETYTFDYNYKHYELKNNKNYVDIKKI